MNKYTYPKKKFDKKDVNFMYVLFDNGDYISINGSEVIDLKISLYDRLVWNEQGVCPVAESGFIKLKINRINKAIYREVFLYDVKEYKKDRIAYIQNRCVNEGGIACVRLFNENNWHDTIRGNIVGELDGEFLVLKFLSQTNFGSSGSANNEILLNPISKSMIRNIDLDFENCESYTIYRNEILDIQLEFESELVWGAGDLFRSVKSGFIKCKLDQEIDCNRQVHFLSNGKVTIKKLEQRLCGRKGEAEHDLCHLYIGYEYAGFGVRSIECIEVEDIRPDEELERLEQLEEEGKICFMDYIGGYCKRQQDGTYIITFGKNAENLLKKLS